MDETSLVTQCGVRSDKDVVGDSLPENLDLEDVGDDLLRLAIQIRVDERNVVVANDYISQSRQALLHSLNSDGGRQRVSQMLQFLIRCGRGNKQAMTVAYRQASNYTGTSDGGVDDRDNVTELCLEDRVEVGRGSKGSEAVSRVSTGSRLCRVDSRIGEFGKDANVGRVFELTAWCEL